MRLLLLVLLFLHIASVAARAQNDQPKTPQQCFLDIVTLVEHRDRIHGLNKFIGELHAYPRDAQNIGFGCTRHVVPLTDYFWMAVVAYKGEVMQFEIRYTHYKEMVDGMIRHDSALKRRVAALGAIKKASSFIVTNDTVYGKYAYQVAQSLGPAGSLPAGANARDAYYFALLSQPVYEYNVGYNCGIDGDEPEGRKAIEYFKEKKDSTAVRALINSHNNEGRIYAVQALLHMARWNKVLLTPRDKLRIRKVLELDIPIHECSGCRSSTVKGADLIDKRDLVDVLQN